MEVTLKVPKTINDISLRQYIKWAGIVEQNKDVQNNFLEIKLLETFCDIDGRDAAKVNLNEASEAIDHIVGLLQGEQPLTQRFKMVGSDGAVCEFGFIPNLSKMTLGEYVDLDTYITDTKTLNRAMAVLYRPVHESWKNKDAYRIAEYGGTDMMADIMMDMPLGIALGALVFFYRLEKKLLLLSMHSSAKQLMKEAEHSAEGRKRFLSAMDGIKAYMHSLKVTRLELTPLPDSMLSRH